METTLEPRKCALDNCNNVFDPTVYWQIYCCPKHADKARKVRQRDRIKKALQMLDNYEAGDQ
jgi:hypothetical protein